MERKKSVEAWAPVYLVDDTDGKTPETGKTYSDVTVKYAKEGATSFATKTMSASDWQEIGDGFYRVKFSATELDTAGNFAYEVYASGTRRFPGHIDIVENIEKDTYDILNHGTYGNSAIKSAVDTKASPADILQDPGTDKIDGSHLDKAITALNDLSTSDVKTQADQALADYDPPTRAEATSDKQAILDDHTLMKQKTAGSYDRDTDSLEALRDRGDAAWALTASQVWQHTTRTLTSFGTLVSDIWNAGTRTLTSFGSLVSDIWSYATRTLTGGGDASQAKQDEILQDLDEMKKTTTGTFDRDPDSLEAIRDRGDAAWGGSGTASEVWSYETRTLTAGGDASQAKQDEILQDLDEIKEKSEGSFDRDTDSLEALRDHGDEAWTGEGGAAGEGSVTVNHNTGGTDNLRYITSAGAGIEDAYVRAYLKADYDAGNRSAAFVKAVVRTGPDGRWVQDMKLDPATYVFEFVKQGAYGPDTKEVAVTE